MHPTIKTVLALCCDVTTILLCIISYRYNTANDPLMVWTYISAALTVRVIKHYFVTNNKTALIIFLVALFISVLMLLSYWI